MTKATELLWLQDQPRGNRLLGFPVDRMLPVKTAVLAELQFVRGILLVLGRRVIASLALSAGKGHDVAHGSIL
jgi:hypothetical protein